MADRHTMLKLQEEEFEKKFGRRLGLELEENGNVLESKSGRFAVVSQ